MAAMTSYCEPSTCRQPTCSSDFTPTCVVLHNTGTCMHTCHWCILQWCWSEVLVRVLLSWDALAAGVLCHFNYTLKTTSN